MLIFKVKAATFGIVLVPAVKNSFHFKGKGSPYLVYYDRLIILPLVVGVKCLKKRWHFPFKLEE